MRDLDNRDLITGDFILVSGDVISNLPIEPALAKHRARREKDKNAIMTMILREGGIEHRTKNKCRRPVFVIDPTAERCLHYEEMSHGQKGGRYVNIDPDLLFSHAEIDVREDLVDCYIDICTPDVLGLWSDNFDYQSVRKSFLFGVLKDYELNGKTIHTHIIKDYYAARARNLRSYNSVSKDIISRWTYPLCPDSNLVAGQQYILGRGNVYEEEGVILARNSLVKARSVVGRGTSIGEGSTVGDSVLGRRCQIGKNVRIEGSYIWNDAVVGDGSVVSQAIVANEAVVGRHCRVEPGALLSYGVRIADHTTIPGTSKITRASRKSEDASTETDFHLVGQGGTGHSYVSDPDSDSDTSSTISSRLVYSRALASSSASSISTVDSEESNVDFHRSDTSRRSSFRSDPSEDVSQNRDFHVEATASILDGMTKGDSMEVIHLELLSQRLSANADDHMMRSALISAIMKRISTLIDNENSGASDAVKKVLSTYRGLVTQMGIFDTEEQEKKDQVDLLLLIQRECMEREKGEQLLLFVVKELYEGDVVEEEGVEQWWEDARGKEGGMEKVRGVVAEFVKWLREAEEDEDSEEESEEDAE